MRRFFTCTLLLVLIALVSECWCRMKLNVHSRVRRDSSRVACQILQENFTASLQFVNEECRNAVLPVFNLFGEFQNVTVAEMAAAATCIPACQSLYDLQVRCLGLLVTDNRTTFHCGRNHQGQACYEAYQLNNGSRAFDACRNNRDACSVTCAAELLILIEDVGCCVSSFAYDRLHTDSGSFFDNCSIDMPDFCPHNFRVVDESDSRRECQVLQANLFSGLQFVEEECRNSVLAAINLLTDIQNVTVPRMAATAICIPACQSFYDLQIRCEGETVTYNRTTFYCGENLMGQACYEAFQLNNGSRAFAACRNNGDNCTLFCADELRNLNSDVGCCVNSFAYGFLNAPDDCIYDTCGVPRPGFCPHLFNSQIPTTTEPTPAGTGFCEAEATEFLLWPNTPAGTTHSVRCPTTFTIINRTCSPSGVWESVDPSLCTPFTSINVDNITLGNFDEILMNLSGAVRGAAMNEQEQTTSNLAMVTAAFARSAQLTNEMIVIQNATVRNLVNILEGLQQWDVDVLRVNSSNIVRSFEEIVSVFAQQPRDGDRFSVMTDNILFVAELVPQTELTANGRSFSSSGQTGNTNTNALSEDETAAAFLPASLFGSVTGRDDLGIFFAVYDIGVLFPIANDTQMHQDTDASVTTVVGSSVLAATVGPGLNFTGLEEPVRILLRMNENVTSRLPRCVSWDFNLEQWTTEGCQTAVNGDIVTCTCNHLTNFAILVDICSRFQDCMPSPVLETVLEALTIVGVALSLIGIVATIVTLLLFKKLRNRDATKFHIQLCIALFGMLIVFVCGINRTSVYGGCVLVSILVHYFTLSSVMWMGAEAVLMFQKLVLVFRHTTTKFIIAVSLICWLVPIIPVVIPVAVDLADAVSRDLVVRRPTAEIQGFCFVFDPAVFFGAFLGPIFAILIFNVVIFVMVIGVLITHTRNTLEHTKQQMDKKTAIRLLISIAGVMFLFGLTWLFGALTVTGFGDSRASTAFQVLFVILNAFQGFFIFLFFCVFSKDARDSWLELLPCGCKRSKSLHPTQAAKHGASGSNAKVKIAETNLTNPTISSNSGHNSSTDDLIDA